MWSDIPELIISLSELSSAGSQEEKIMARSKPTSCDELKLVNLTKDKKLEVRSNFILKTQS